MEITPAANEDGLKPRKNIRYALEGDVSYLTEFSTDPMRLKNVSKDGLCCVCKRIFEPGEEFMVVFGKSMLGDLTYLRVRAVWNRRGENGQHELGAQFLTETLDINKILNPEAPKADFCPPVTLPETQEVPVDVPESEKSVETKTEKSRPSIKVLIVSGVVFCVVVAGLFFAADKTGALDRIPFIQKATKLSGIYYDSNGGSYAIVGGRILKEGDSVTQDTVIDKISTHTVRFLIRGKAVVKKVGSS